MNVSARPGYVCGYFEETDTGRDINRTFAFSQKIRISSRIEERIPPSLKIQAQVNKNFRFLNFEHIFRRRADEMNVAFPGRDGMDFHRNSMSKLLSHGRQCCGSCYDTDFFGLTGMERDSAG